MGTIATYMAFAGLHRDVAIIYIGECLGCPKMLKFFEHGGVGYDDANRKLLWNLLISAIRADFLSALLFLREWPMAPKGRTGSDLADELRDPNLSVLESTLKKQKVDYASAEDYDEDRINAGVIDTRSILNRWEGEGMGGQSLASSESSGNVNIAFNQGRPPSLLTLSRKATATKKEV